MKNKSQDIYELSPLQEAFLYHSITDESSSAYFSQLSYEISGKVDEALFEESLAQLFDRHSILRTAFVYEGLKKPYQVVIKDRRAELHFKDLRHLEASAQAHYFQDFAEAEKQRNFNLTKDPLMRIHIFITADAYYHLFWSFHHILFDGWSFAKLINEFSYIYSCLEKGLSIDLAPALPYKHFIKWLEKKDKQQAVNYWKNHLANYEQCAILPRNNASQEKRRFEQGEIYLGLGQERTARLAQIAAEQQVTLNTLVLCLWGVLLARYNNRKDVVFGKISSMRPPEIVNIESMVGLFINPLPIRIRYDEQTSFKNLLEKVQQDNLDAEACNYCSLAEIQATTSLKKSLIDHMLVFGNELATRGEDLSDEVKSTESWQVETIHHREEVNYDFSMHVTTAEEIYIIFTYNQFEYATETIQAIANQFEHLANQVLAAPDVPVDTLTLLLPSEQKQQLNWSGIQKNYVPLNFQDLFEQWAQQKPAQLAVVSGNCQWSYQELNERAYHLAHHLENQYQLQYQQRVALFMDRSQWSVMSLLAIWKLGAIYVPIDIQYPADRIQEILQEAEIDLVLIHSEVEDRLPASSLPLVRVDQLEKVEVAPLRKVVPPDAIAYLIHTSGTAGKPKRIPLRHESISDRIQYHNDFMALDHQDKVLHFAGLHFDSSLVEIGMALLSGGTLVIADAMSKSNPAKLLELLERERVSTAIFTPAFLKLLQKHPLPTLQNIISTGEAAALEETLFYAQTKAFYNGYGPSEACIGATFHKVDPKRVADYQQLGSILIGKPFYNTRVYIMDEKQRLLPQGVPGEITIAGVGVTRGYLDRPDLTREKFVANPFATDNREKMLYRSGDLGRWTKQGELEFLGRIDEQVQIRGIRVELREIEHQIAQHPQIQDVRVLALEQENEGLTLVAYVIEKSQLNTTQALREHLAQSLPVYMIPSYFVAVDHFPLTSNGKLDKAALPALEEVLEQQDATVDNHLSEAESKMITIWQTILGDENIGVNSNFFDHGGHSLKAVTLILNIHRELKQNIDIQDVFDNPTPRLLCLRMSMGNTKTYEKIPKAAKRALYEASPSQKRTWLLSQFEGATTIYNVPDTFLLEGAFRPEALIQTVQMLLARHEILRTSFVMEDGALMQRIIPFRKDFLVIEQLDYTANEAAETDLQRLMALEYELPFDMEEGPLLRMKLIQLEAEKYVFLYTLHHIIGDGWSMQLFFKELMQGYRAFSQDRQPVLAPLAIQHKDYTEWLHQQLSSDSMENLRNYWHQQFADEIPVLDFPLDRVRPAAKTFNASALKLEIPPALLTKLKALAKAENLTIFMLLLGALKALLAKYTQQTDLVIGTVIAAREQPELQDQLGFFSNTLPLRTRFEQKDSISTFLQKIKTVVKGAFQHQAFPFDYLVDELEIKRDIRRSPIFDIMLTHQNVDLFDAEIPETSGLQVEPYSLGTVNSARFDLEFVFTEYDELILGNIMFNTDLFFPETIERFCNHFLRLLEAFTEDTQISMHRVNMIEAEEQRLLLQEFNATGVDLEEKTFLDFFAEQVAKSPEEVALNCEEREVSYEELAEHSNQIAWVLKNEYQVEAEQIIGFYAERSEWWITGMIGIMKSGAAYLPISIREPEDRIGYMLKDVGVTMILTNGSSLPVFDDLPQLDIQDVDFESVDKTDQPTYWPGMDKLAYILFTSGSTGRPKAVAIEHHSMINHLLAKRNDLRINENSIVAQIASPIFDVSMWQSLTALIAGGYTRIYHYDLVMDPLALAKEMDYDEVTVFQAVPSYLASLLESLRQFNSSLTFSHLKCLVVGGEMLPPVLLENWFSHFLFARVINQYGPTETCDGVSFYPMQAPSTQGTVPIGRPHQNVRVYILNEQQQLCPIGVKGEIYVSGEGVARGYINQPELTEAAFFADPFFPGQRMYRSKDLGRWTAAGLLECFGRNDHQVKVRGHRIELGEIEHAFYRLPFIGKVAILEKGSIEQGKYLCAYFTLKFGMMATLQETRKRLAELIPNFMIPEQMFILEEFPLTAGLKIDRKRLPEPEATLGQEVARVIEAPNSPTEVDLLEIWKEVLALDKISTNDNFFEIGGHSFKAIKIQTQIFKRMGVKLTIKTIFMHPNIQALATHIDTNFSVEMPSAIN